MFSYLCCLEQQLIIYSVFLNLFFSLYQWTFTGKKRCDESFRSWGLIHLVFSWCLFFKHAATAEPPSSAAEIVLNVLFPGLFGLLLHATASLVHLFCHQITHHFRRWTLTTPLASKWNDPKTCRTKLVVLPDLGKDFDCGIRYSADNLSAENPHLLFFLRSSQVPMAKVVFFFFLMI